MSDAKSVQEERNEAYSRAVPHSKIQGLYPSFSTAVTILRIARSLGELELELEFEEETEVDVNEREDERAHLDTFYEKLSIIERSLLERNNTTRHARRAEENSPFVVVVEGLDGTGKTSLVRSLAETLKTGSAWSTPTASMANVRNVFDRRGGAVARAFYMASNYVLQYEIQGAYDKHEQKHAGPGPVFVVDRWYNSTCAYSIGWKNTVGTPEESVDLLDASLFCWPVDLQLVPELVILLQVEDSVRKERIRLRRRELEISEPTSTINHNPWDGRLDADENLGKRILRVMERVTGPREVMKLHATFKTQEQVLREALQTVTDRVQRHYRPVDYFQKRPLQFFRWISSRLDLCDAATGMRRKHQPWAIQLALNNNNCRSSAAPSLRSVGIHSVNAAGILFFTRSGHPGGCQVGDISSLAAMVCVGGSYPNEHQWRAEGILVESTPAECELLQTLPPNSLVAQYVACQEQEQEQIVCDDKEGEQGIESGSQHYGVTARRYDRPATYTEDVVRRRREDPRKHAASAFRFVPLRMEVLIGGPVSPSGPHRYEWNREIQNSTNSNGWSKARPILPFRQSPEDGDALCDTKLQNRPITLVLTGCHCAGKATLGKKIASTMSWLFQQELGDILRDEEHVVAGGHRVGDGSGDLDAQSWDDRIHSEEMARDRQPLGNRSSPNSRVVETWHVGNLAWALMRKEAQPGSSLEDRNALVDKARTAIREHQKESVILFVHLSISVDVCLKRRKAPENSGRLPMDDERKECLELHRNMEEKGLDLLHTELKDLGVPLLVIDNSLDGESAIEDSTRRIVRFVHENLWRTAL